MGMKNKRGFTLLIAVIFMGVMLSLGLALSSLGYKQVLLAGGATASQYAFFAADAGLECALRADEKPAGGVSPFAYSNHGTPLALACGGQTPTIVETCYNGSPAGSCASGYRRTETYVSMMYTNPLSQTAGTDTRCAKITTYKPSGNGTTYIFSQGYDTTCANVQSASAIRFASRGLEATYQQ